MADRRLRLLEREAAGGDPAARLQLLRELQRTGGEGVAPGRLELAAFLLHPHGEAAVGAAPGTLPSAAFDAGRRVHLETVRRIGRDPLETHVTCLDGSLGLGVARLAGYTGSRSAPHLPDVLDELGQLGLRRLVLDLSRSAGINSTGLGLLCRQADDRARDGGGLVVVPTPSIRSVMDLLGLQPFVALEPDVPAAVAALRRAAQPEGALAPRAWLLRLTRWGPDVCVRAALALVPDDAGRGDPRVAEASAAAEAWLACPCPRHAEAAGRAAPAARAAALELGDEPRASAGFAAFRAAETAGRGIWPSPRLAPFEVAEADRAAVRDALFPWALGLV